MATNKKYLPAGRLISTLLTVIFAAASVHSTVFIFVHAGHKHAHKDYDADCAVCTQLASAVSMMNSFSPPITDAQRVAVLFEQCSDDSKIVYSYDDISTPVLLKVKMNN